MLVLRGAGESGVHGAVTVVVIVHRAGLHAGGKLAGAREQVAGIVEEVLDDSTGAAVCNSEITKLVRLIVVLKKCANKITLLELELVREHTVDNAGVSGNSGGQESVRTGRFETAGHGESTRRQKLVSVLRKFSASNREGTGLIA